ncbi:MAG TPA: hypothetical protein DE313_06400 [Ruminococcus sp.]|nr:hypothetical protein [Ruminococcus sp.]
MKCPNCRCFVPQNKNYCLYCGYELASGAAKTLTVEEYYRDYLNYVDEYSDNNQLNVYYEECYPNTYSNYADNQQYDDSTDMTLIEILLGTICALLILSLILVII